MVIAWIAAQVQIRYGATLPVFMHAPAHRFKLWVNERNMIGPRNGLSVR